MIKNITKNKTIVTNHEICETFFSKLKGLMFSSRDAKNNHKNLVFVFNKEQRIGLHMWFVWFSIDVILLDSNKKVVEIKENFKPFRLFNSKEKAKYVLELNHGAVKDGSIEVNDVIKII
ncbi:MAG: DUF192 domain-containing protein [Candidatus Woesearchaeota archaeon]